MRVEISSRILRMLEISAILVEKTASVASSSIVRGKKGTLLILDEPTIGLSNVFPGVH